MPARGIALTFVRGFAMGSADIVPGVSGGTVALVLGIYRRLIDAIRFGSSALGHFVKLDLRGGVERIRQVEWAFLLPLLAGIGAALLSLSFLIEMLLEDYPVEMAACCRRHRHRRHDPVGDQRLVRARRALEHRSKRDEAEELHV